MTSVDGAPQRLWEFRRRDVCDYRLEALRMNARKLLRMQLRADDAEDRTAAPEKRCNERTPQPSAGTCDAGSLNLQAQPSG